MQQFDFASGSLPSTEELSSFMAVVDAGSFAAAAERLGVARSNVSRRVAQLESRLDARLLHRTTRSVELTELGRMYYEEVNEAMSRLQSATNSVHNVHARPSGRLRISAPSDSGPLLAGLIVDFRVAYPEVQVELDMSQRRVDLISEGFDVALRAGNLQDSSLVARPLTTSRFGLFCSEGYAAQHGLPQTIEEVEAHPAILFSSRSDHQQVELIDPEGQTHKLKLTGGVSVQDFILMRLLLGRHIGIGVLPMVGEFPREHSGCGDTKLLQVLPGWRSAPGKMSLVYPSARLVSAKLRCFCDFALNWMTTEVGRKAANSWLWRVESL